MPHPRFLKLEPARRDRIIEAAAQEFAARGYDNASLNQVIAQLGLSKGQFYYYFNDKADLFTAVLDWVWERVVPNIWLDLSSLEAETFWPTLEQMVDRSRGMIRTMPWYIGLMRHIFYPPADEAVRAVLAKKVEQARQIHLDLVRRGQALGCVRRDVPEELLLSLSVAFDNAADRWVSDRWDALSQAERDVLSTALFVMYRRMMEPEP